MNQSKFFLADAPFSSTIFFRRWCK